MAVERELALTAVNTVQLSFPMQRSSGPHEQFQPERAGSPKGQIMHAADVLDGGIVHSKADNLWRPTAFSKAAG